MNEASRWLVVVLLLIGTGVLVGSEVALGQTPIVTGALSYVSSRQSAYETQQTQLSRHLQAQSVSDEHFVEFVNERQGYKVSHPSTWYRYESGIPGKYTGLDQVLISSIPLEPNADGEYPLPVRGSGVLIAFESNQLLPGQSLADYVNSYLISPFWKPTTIRETTHGDLAFVEMSGDLGRLLVAGYGANAYSLFLPTANRLTDQTTVESILASFQPLEDDPIATKPGEDPYASGPVRIFESTPPAGQALSSTAPSMRFPWDRNNGGRRYSGGPHVGTSDWHYEQCNPHPLSDLRGIDFGLGSSDAVLAVASGTVTYWSEGCNKGVGNYVQVDHGGGWITQYWHLSSISQWVKDHLNAVDAVQQGQVLGQAGRTCGQTDEHLHVQLKNHSWHGVSIDGYVVYAIIDANDLSRGLNYQGTLTRGDASLGSSKVYTCSESQIRSARIWTSPVMFEAGDGQRVDSTNPPERPVLTLVLGSLLHNRQATVELRRTSGFGQYISVFETSATTDDAGTIRNLALEGVQPDTYHLLVKPQGWLRRQRSNVTLVAGSNSLDMERDFLEGNCRSGGLWAGDILGDNKVNIFDFARLAEDFGGDPPNPRSDLDGNGHVDIYDLTYLSEDYHCSGDGGDIPWAQAASTNQAEGSGMLSLSPTGVLAQAPSQELEPGGIVTLTLEFDTDGLPVEGIEAVIDYDHCAVELLEERIVHSNVLSTVHTMSFTDEFQYSVHEWAGASSPSSPLSGTGYLAKIPFRVVAGTTSPTNVALRFARDGTTESNMAEDGTIQEVLGSVVNASLPLSGLPQRPARHATVSLPTSGEFITTSSVVLQAEAFDPCDGLRKAVFSVFYDGQWHVVGTDADGSDGWSVYWDANEIVDQAIRVKAFVSDMAGNGVETPSNDNIVLDRQPPVVLETGLTPDEAEPGAVVLIAVHASDNLAGIRRIYFWVDPSTDSSTPWGSWDLLGSSPREVVIAPWDTEGYTPGLHRLLLALEDMAGNQTYWPPPGEPLFTYRLLGPFPVVINELDLGDSDAVEFFNPGMSPVEMTGWSFKAAADWSETIYSFPSFTLAPGSYAVLHEIAGTNTATDLYVGRNISWVNGGNGSASLSDSSGQGVDFVRWGDCPDQPPAGTSWAGANPASPHLGYNMGREGSGTDTDYDSDWCVQSPSLGTRNAGCLYRADVDSDGDVDIADIQAVASRWRCACGDGCYEDVCDLNDDCRIDVVDIMLVAAYWGHTCP